MSEGENEHSGGFNGQPKEIWLGSAGSQGRREWGWIGGGRRELCATADLSQLSSSATAAAASSSLTKDSRLSVLLLIYYFHYCRRKRMRGI